MSVELTTYPLNDKEYYAEDAELFHCTRTSGVFASDDFAISDALSGFGFTIGEGLAWIRNAKFTGKATALKESATFSLNAPDATYSRIDAVVIRYQQATNNVQIIVESGTPASVPVAPSMNRTELVYDLQLYHILVPPTATSFSDCTVTDLRSDVAFCGLMYDDVSPVGDLFVEKSQVGVAGGVASLNNEGKVPSSQLPILATTATISTAWTGSSVPYLQTISVDGVKANSVVEISLSPSASKTQVDAFNNLVLVDGGQSDGKITLRAFGDKNTTAIPINVIIGGEV